MTIFDPSKYNSAIFLPAISSFYTQTIDVNAGGEGRQIPNFEHGLDGLNFFDEKGYFQYPFALFSAGHADLDIKSTNHGETMIRSRDRSKTTMVGDSGGFQIATGKWQANWLDPNDEDALKQKEKVLRWLEEFFDYSMMLDIPSWSWRNPLTGIKSTEEAMQATLINCEYFIQKRTPGKTKILNVLQGATHAESKEWYERVKKYSDPKLYPDRYFEGWAMGGQNMKDIELALKRLVDLCWDGLLEPGKHNWIHFLGTSKLSMAVALSDIKQAINENFNSELQISFDCASPFIAVANGLLYTYNILNQHGQWSYIMDEAIDSKQHSTNAIPFDEFAKEFYVSRKSGTFESSPVSQRLLLNDVCYYKTGDTNKIGKSDFKTSWDTISYLLLMGHNTYAHLKAVELANEIYYHGREERNPDGSTTLSKIYPENFLDVKSFREVVFEIFRADSREKAFEIIEAHRNMFIKINGTDYETLSPSDEDVLIALEKEYVLDVKKPKKPMKQKPKVALTAGAYFEIGVVNSKGG